VRSSEERREARGAGGPRARRARGERRPFAAEVDSVKCASESARGPGLGRKTRDARRAYRPARAHRAEPAHRSRFEVTPVTRWSLPSGDPDARAEEVRRRRGRRIEEAPRTRARALYKTQPGVSLSLAPQPRIRARAVESPTRTARLLGPPQKVVTKCPFRIRAPASIARRGHSDGRFQARSPIGSGFPRDRPIDRRIDR
jgi:hypothetical protein